MPNNHDSTWDFSPVYHLLHTLSHRDTNAPDDKSYSTLQQNGNAAAVKCKSQNNTVTSGEDGGVILGNFGKVWDFLGLQHDAPAPTMPPFEAYTASQKPDADAYQSDGAIYYPASSKSVQWRDEVDHDAGLADTQEDSPHQDSSEGPLTRKQRKNRSKKDRKAAELAELAAKLTEKSEKGRPSQSQESYSSSKAPVQHAGVSRGLREYSEPISQFSVKLPQSATEKDGSSTHQDEANVGSSKKQRTKPKIPQMAHPLRPLQVTPSSSDNNEIQAKTKRGENFQTKSQFNSNTQQKVELPRTPPHQLVKSLHESLRRPGPLAQHLVPTDRLRSGVPSGNDSTPTTSLQPPTQTKDLTSFPTIPKNQQPRGFHELAPLNLHNSTDRHWSLLLKLLHNFPEDRKALLSPLQLSINQPHPTGIHVFVDASNILIGFMEQLKVARGIPLAARVPRVFPYFHALALLLERRRPVAKRVLAGSTPEVPAYEEARQVGYETNILDKVWKAKELTEKQRRAALKAVNPGNRSSGGYASGSDSANDSHALGEMQRQKPKWVEQAVDEIIHLKMLESLVDAPAATGSNATPPTMILATGDAAEAEYSSGFMKMVQRALDKGWHVEVAAWGASISMDYRNMARRGKWAGRFRIIELDEYAEELFSDIS